MIIKIINYYQILTHSALFAACSILLNSRLSSEILIISIFPQVLIKFRFFKRASLIFVNVSSFSFCMEYNWGTFWFNIVHGSFRTIITWWRNIINFKFIFTSEAYLRFYILTKWFNMAIITLWRYILNSFFFYHWFADSCWWRSWPNVIFSTCWIIQTRRRIWIRYELIWATKWRSECNVSSERLEVAIILSWRWSDFYRHFKSDFRFYYYTLWCWFNKRQSFVNIISTRPWIFIWFFGPYKSESHLFITCISKWLWLIVSSRS